MALSGGLAGREPWKLLVAAFAGGTVFGSIFATLTGIIVYALSRC